MPYLEENVNGVPGWMGVTPAKPWTGAATKSYASNAGHRSSVNVWVTLRLPGGRRSNATTGASHGDVRGEGEFGIMQLLVLFVSFVSFVSFAVPVPVPVPRVREEPRRLASAATS